MVGALRRPHRSALEVLKKRASPTIREEPASASPEPRVGGGKFSAQSVNYNSPLSFVCSRIREHLRRSLAQSHSGLLAIDELHAGPLQGVLDGIEVGRPQRQHSRVEIGDRGLGHDRGASQLGLRRRWLECELPWRSTAKRSLPRFQGKPVSLVSVIEGVLVVVMARMIGRIRRIRPRRKAMEREHSAWQIPIAGTVHRDRRRSTASLARLTFEIPALDLINVVVVRVPIVLMLTMVTIENRPGGR
jgi:hypothetical protein